jgi:hypothetical protein
MLRFKEEVLWTGKWLPNDGHLLNIKKCLDKCIKYKSSAPADILHGDRGLEFYFGNNARKVLQYFVNQGFGAIGGALQYQGRVITDSGDLSILATNLNKQKFMPSAEFIQWVNSD